MAKHELWTRQGQVVRVKDGDSVIFNLDQGWNLRLHVDCRIVGLNTPERHPRQKTNKVVHREAGLAATRFAVEWLIAGLDDREEWPFLVESTGLDGRGRSLGRVTRKCDGADYLADALAAGVGRPYSGKAKRRVWLKRELTPIAGYYGADVSTADMKELSVSVGWNFR